MRKTLFLALLTALVANAAHALPPWTYTNTGTNHTVIIDTSVHPAVNGLPLTAGDYIGVFYDSNGTLGCAGYEIWSGSGAITVAAFGNDLVPPAKDGLIPGEVFKWKIWRKSDGSVTDAQATYKPPGGIISDTGRYVPNGLSSLRTLVALSKFLITSSAGPNGTISPAGVDTVQFGGSQRFIISPSTGYHTDSLIVDGFRVDSTTSYTFTAVVANHTIRAVFRINSYTLTAAAGANGTIAPSGAVNVTYGANQQFIMTPATGYHVDSVIVDGSKVDSTTSYTFTAVVANHTIRAVFRINSYTITATAGVNGTIAPSGSINVTYGANQQFIMTPATGYHVDSVIVDGSKVDSTTSYTFNVVAANHTIRIVFKINGETITATAGPNGNITPSGPVDVTYGSNKQFIMTPATGYHVDSVLVDGSKVDSTTSYTFNTVTTNHTIRVVFKINSYTLTATAGANGTIAPSGTVNVTYGANQQFIITPATGYHVDSLLVDGVKVDSTTSYTFKSIAADRTIRAVFKINSFTISATAGANGTITPSGSVNVTYNANQQFTIAPSAGYHIDSVLVDGSRVDSTTSYTFNAVVANHTIRAVFRINSYTITATAGVNGTIAPSGSVNVTYGSNQQFITTPATGYHVDSLIVDGSKVDSTVSYTFRNVTTGHTIRVAFRINSYTITVLVGAHGSITPSGIILVNYGATQAFTVTPDSGCHTDSVIVDGVNKGPLPGYLFANVTVNHTIAARFSTGPSVLMVRVNSGWNIISLPVRPGDYHKSVLFPSANSFAFGYAGQYVIQDTLACGSGYWLKFNHNQTIPLNGYVFPAESLAVGPGWNLIGSASYAISAVSILSIPPGLVTSRFFQYEEGYSITDTLQPGQGYWVKVKQAGKLILTSSTGGLIAANRISIVPTEESPPAVPDDENVANNIPKSYILEQNYPNPFNPVTTIRYDLPVASYVTLRVYNILGEEITMLVSALEDPGHKSVSFDGNKLPGGLYFIRLDAGTFTDVKKMMLVK